MCKSVSSGEGYRTIMFLMLFISCVFCLQRTPSFRICMYVYCFLFLFSGSQRAVMLEYIRAELFPLVNSLRSILFSAFYLLLTFVSAMLVCQICARVIFVYLLKSRHLRTTKIYQLSSTVGEDPQDFPEKDMYEGQSLIAESCESGVYDMTSWQFFLSLLNSCHSSDV